MKRRAPRSVLLWALLLGAAACQGSVADPGGAASGSGGGGGDEPGTPTDGVVTTTRVARLTHTQYDNTVAELFGISDRFAGAFAPDAQNGFSFSTSIDFRVDARLGPQYRAAAEQIAELAVTDDAVFARTVPCEVNLEGGCVSEFIGTFVERAFRRPITADEQLRFEALFAKGADLVGSGDDFRDGVRLVVEAALQSPQFLYRTELGDQVDADGFIALNDWEIASRLSYFLWDSMPDEALFERAREGALRTPAQVRAEVERLLDDPRATSKLVRFHEQVWHFDRFTKISPDPSIFPDAPSVQSVRAAAARFVEEVAADGGGLVELLTAPYAFADATLAPVYGASVTGGLQRIELDPGVRKGFLMQVGFLASNAYAVRTDPIHRGLLIARDLLCAKIPDPPPGASMTPPPETDTPPRTTREEVSLLTGQPTCVNCHSMINPAGFAFENFDAIGQVRQTENGVPVDTTGSIVIDGAEIEFDGAPELVDAVAASAEARACYSTRWIEFAQGRAYAKSDDASRDALAAGPKSIRELVADVAVTRAFLSRAPNEEAP
ncbi:MAG TPA: DUF1592 domain-containing protein [Polyangiaceae bacterium]|nr:DUF1592 domain-containing protein [Polyangiaceae bacterium]